LTLGIVYIFTNIVLWIWGPFSKMGSPPSFLKQTISVSGFIFPKYRLAIIVIGLVIFFLFWWLQDRTRVGSIIRAGMDDKQMTIGLGINYGLVSTSVFIIGTIMGGIAGFFGAPIVGLFPEMSMQILLIAMIVVVIGGIGKVQGALIGSLIIAYIDTFGKAFFPDFAMFTVYLIFIIMLLLKPNGILGRKTI
jgi:branched-chain amino acid transport system permease protein